MSSEGKYTNIEYQNFFEKNLSSNFVKFERAKYENTIVKIITDIIRNFEKYNTFFVMLFFWFDGTY